MPVIPLSAAPLVAAGAVAVGGLLGYNLTRTDGSEYISRRYGPDVVITPRSQDAARESIVHQRAFGAVTIAAGAALSCAGALSPSLGRGAAIAGAAIAGWGIGKLIKLDGAEKHLSQGLPEHTQFGTPNYDHAYRGWGYGGFGGIGGYGSSSLGLHDFSTLTAR